MKRIFPGIAIAAIVAVSLGAGGLRPDVRPVDRWLISDPIPPDSTRPGSALERDLLTSPGEPGVLPERGREAAGVTWRLVRDDGSSRFNFDSIAPAPGSVVYAHSYVRLPADRTMRVEWSGLDCTAARAWLNGRELAASPVRARLGGGWNTLLVKLEVGSCTPGLDVGLASVDGEEVGSIRVQASRPFGDVRTGPADWVVADDTARIDDERRWLDGRLHAGVRIGLTAWGRAPVPNVRVELRDGVDGEATAPWLVPGEPGAVVVRVRLDRLHETLERGVVVARIRWREEERDRELVLEGRSPDPTTDVALDGWEVASVRGREPRDEEAGQLPNREGWILKGEWKVPESLSGRSLALDAASAPANYRVNGTDASDGTDGSGPIRLCGPCSKGTTIRISATSTGAWAHAPVVAVDGGS